MLGWRLGSQSESLPKIFLLMASLPGFAVLYVFGKLLAFIDPLRAFHLWVLVTSLRVFIANKVIHRK